MGSFQGPCKVSITGMPLSQNPAGGLNRSADCGEQWALLPLEVSSHCWGTELLRGRSEPCMDLGLFARDWWRKPLSQGSLCLLE